MFTSHYLNNPLNNIHERALQLTYNGHDKSFNSILTEKTIHKKTLNFLQYANFKIACLRQSWMIFSSQDKAFIISDSFSNFPPQLKTLWISAQNLSLYRGLELWNLIPDNIKSEPTLELSKKKIRKWECEPCPCRTSKTYLQHIGLIS